MKKVSLGTIWLDACSGCHMSFLDMDEHLLTLPDNIELVYGPLVDAKTIPDDVDVFLVTGAVSTEEEIEKAREVREKARIVVSFGDCAVTGNVPSMRNGYGSLPILQEVYCEEGTECSSLPGLTGEKWLPRLLKRVRPLHEVVEVDEYIQGCPPGAQLIQLVLGELMAGRIPRRGVRTHFG